MKTLLLSEIQTLAYMLIIGVITKAAYVENIARINRELAIVGEDHGY